MAPHLVYIASDNESTCSMLWPDCNCKLAQTTPLPPSPLFSGHPHAKDKPTQPSLTSSTHALSMLPIYTHFQCTSAISVLVLRGREQNLTLRSFSSVPTNSELRPTTVAQKTDSLPSKWSSSKILQPPGRMTGSFQPEGLQE